VSSGSGADSGSSRSSVSTQPRGGKEARRPHEQGQRVDDCAVQLDTRRTKAERTDLAKVKTALQEGLRQTSTTEGLAIRFLRPGPETRIEVVFADKGQAALAQKHPQWATTAMPGTRVQGDTWYPVKCDMVAK